MNSEVGNPAGPEGKKIARFQKENRVGERLREQKKGRRERGSLQVEVLEEKEMQKGDVELLRTDCAQREE